MVIALKVQQYCIHYLRDHCIRHQTLNTSSVLEDFCSYQNRFSVLDRSADNWGQSPFLCGYHVGRDISLPPAGKVLERTHNNRALPWRWQCQHIRRRCEFILGFRNPTPPPGGDLEASDAIEEKDRNFRRFSHWVVVSFSSAYLLDCSWPVQFLVSLLRPWFAYTTPSGLHRQVI